MNRADFTAQLKLDEGLRLFVYDDTAGIPTIGYGRNLRDVGISLDEAESLLEHDIDRTVQALQSRWPRFSTLDDVRQQAVLNMAFNLGIDGLLLFKHLLASLASGAYAQAAQEARNSLWARQVGARAERVAKMIETGELPL